MEISGQGSAGTACPCPSCSPLPPSVPPHGQTLLLLSRAATIPRRGWPLVHIERTARTEREGSGGGSSLFSDCRAVSGRLQMRLRREERIKEEGVKLRHMEVGVVGERGIAADCQKSRSVATRVCVEGLSGLQNGNWPEVHAMPRTEISTLSPETGTATDSTL